MENNFTFPINEIVIFCEKFKLNILPKRKARGFGHFCATGLNRYEGNTGNSGKI